MKIKMPAKAIVFVVISILGFIFFALYDKQVFPAASIDMKISQNEAGAKSKQLAGSLGYDVEHARHVTTFSEDDEAKTVLEFKLGIDKANALMKDQVPVWLWRTRYCKELSKDEMVVVWTTQGKFKSVFHTFENDKKLKTISQDDALALAKQFISTTASLDLSGYDLFDRGSETKPNRVDHHFIWSKPGFSESEFRVKVDIAGDQVSTCRYWLAPKDEWDREYKSIRQWNELLGNIASLFLFLFIAATIGAFIYGVAQHHIRWRFTLISSALVSLLVLLESLNNFNYSLESYDTSITYSSFLTQTALLYFLASAGAFLASVLIVGGAEVVYRATRPAHMAMEHLFSLRGMAQKAYGGKTLMGYLLVGAMMFWAIGYYKVGQKFGYFCPLGVDDYKVLGNFCPAISGALIGVSAAGLEEFTCRVVGLGLLQKMTRSFWLANLLQALIWGFAHSNYPQEPCYARGVELTVVGLLFGYIVKVYGVLPCLIAHYLYDAFLTVEPVFASHKAELIVPSLLILLPFACAVWYSRRWARSKSIEVEAADLSNGAGAGSEPPGHHTAEDVDQETPVYSALTGGKRKTLLLTAMLCLSLLLIPSGDQIGKDKQVSISASKAQELAAKYLAEDGLDFKDYQCVSQLLARPNGSQDSKLMWQHVYEMLGPEKTKTVYNQAAPGLQWQVRFFKPLEPRSYRVYLNGDGSKLYIDVDDLDEATGAKLDEASALSMVQKYIEKNQPELLPLAVDNKTKIVRAKRVDYKFDFLEPKFAANQTPAILHAETKGDKVSLLNLDWNVPDNWSWPRKQQQPIVLTAIYVRNIAFVILAGICLFWGVHLLRITRVPWRQSLKVGLLWSVIAVLGVFNANTRAVSNYDTAETWQSFVGQTLASQATRSLLQIIGCCIISVAGYTAIKQSFPLAWQQLRNWILLRPKTDEQQIVRSNIWVDGALASYAFSAALIALKTVQGLALFHFSPEAPIDLPNRLANLFSTSLPSVDLLAGVFGWIIGAPLVLAVVASLWQRYFTPKAKPLALPLILIVGMAILCGVDSWYWQNCLIGTVYCLFRFLLIWYFVRKVFATNTLAYLFAVGEITSAVYLSDLIAHATKTGALEIAVLLFIILAPALFAILFWRLDRAKS